MSHPVNDEHMEVLGAFIAEFIGMRNRFVEYMAKYELDAFLDENETQFLKDISIACQKFLDTEANNQAKKGKDNGNMGQ